MKYFTFFVILIAFVFIIGMASAAEAHPHTTIDLMESHSHDMHDEVFQESFIVHTFEEVMFSVFDFVNSHYPSKLSITL